MGFFYIRCLSTTIFGLGEERFMCIRLERACDGIFANL